MLSDIGRIIEAISGAAVGLGTWDGALSLIAEATRSRIGQIAVADHGDLRINLLSGASADEAAAYLAAGGPDPSINIRTRAVLTAPCLTGITESDFADASTLERSTIYQTLFKQCDVPFSLQVRAKTAEGMDLVLALQRPKASGLATAEEKQLVQLLTPTVASAIDTSLALGRIIDQDIMRTAEDLAGPALLLDSNMRVVSISAAAETALRHSPLLSIRSGRLMASNNRDHQNLESAFRAVTRGPLTLRRTTRVVFSGAAPSPLPVDICPMPVRMSGPLSSARALVVLRISSQADVEERRAQAAAAFGLTKAEADVAVSIAEGLTVNEVAARRGSSINTTKAQLKAVFGKSGLHRQAELVAAVRAVVGR